MCIYISIKLDCAQLCCVMIYCHVKLIICIFLFLWLPLIFLVSEYLYLSLYILFLSIQVESFIVGDTIEVLENKEIVVKMQEGHGGWADFMENVSLLFAPDFNRFL